MTDAMHHESYNANISFCQNTRAIVPLLPPTHDPLRAPMQYHVRVYDPHNEKVNEITDLAQYEYLIAKDARHLTAPRLLIEKQKLFQTQNSIHLNSGILR